MPVLYLGVSLLHVFVAENLVTFLPTQGPSMKLMWGCPLNKTVSRKVKTTNNFCEPR
jgi:predicted PP-loop superfamily ATPase